MPLSFSFWGHAWSVEWVVLWTDALLYVLIVAAVLLALYIRRHPPLQRPWSRVVRSPMAIGAAVILAAYAAIGLLDSVHVRLPIAPVKGSTVRYYSPELLSVFDLIAGPLRTHTEYSYSAPFATRLYTQETVRLPDGQTRREYPRLKYGGAGLKSAAELGGDVCARVARALAEAGAAWLVAAAALTWRLARRHRCAVWQMALRCLRGDTQVPWRTIGLTFGVVLALGWSAGALCTHYHILGTDEVGRDVFYLSLKSVRTGLVIGTVTTLVMLPFALALGISAGYFRGWVDDVVQYVYTTLNSIPGVLLIAAAVLILQSYMDRHAGLYDTVAARADMRLLFLCLILGITSWTGLCRLLRGETLKLCEADYIQAARAFGVGHGRIITRHILPNVMHIVLISVVLDFSSLVLAEAVLSYVGVGVDPSTISWGNMINSARLEMARQPAVWWPLASAFIFMFALVLSANLFADVVREALDPRTKGRGGER